jgi:predicted nucleic acid-binding protein
MPDAGFSTFLDQVGRTPIFVSVLTMGELRKGVANKRRTDPRAADALAEWVDGIEAKYANHILPVASAIARRWGELSADRPRSAIDTLIAATAIVHGLTVVTRNTVHFADLPVKLQNPWTA